MRSDFTPAFQKNTVSDSSVRRHMSEDTERAKSLADHRHLTAGSVVKLANGKVITILDVRYNSTTDSVMYDTETDGKMKQGDILAEVMIRQAAQKNTLEIVSGGWSDDQPVVIEAVATVVEGEIEDVIFATEDERRYDESFWAKATKVIREQEGLMDEEIDRLLTAGKEDMAREYAKNRSEEIPNTYYPKYTQERGVYELVPGGSHMAGRYKYTITYPQY